MIRGSWLQLCSAVTSLDRLRSTLPRNRRMGRWARQRCPTFHWTFFIIWFLGFKLRMCLLSNLKLPGWSSVSFFLSKSWFVQSKTRKEHSFTKRSKWLIDNWSFKNEFLVPSRGLCQCSMATVNLTSLSNKTAAYQHVSYNWLTSPQLITVLFFARPAGDSCAAMVSTQRRRECPQLPLISYFPSPKHCAS